MRIGRLTRGRQTNFFAFGVRDAGRLLRRNKSTVQRGRKTPGHRTGNGALAPTRERERKRRSTEAVLARAHVFKITINIGRQLAGMFSQMIRAPDIYQPYMSTRRDIPRGGKSYRRRAVIVVIVITTVIVLNGQPTLSAAPLMILV